MFLATMKSCRVWGRTLILLAAVALAGCYPEYNWREIPVADGLAVAAFPAKVNGQSRTITLAGVDMEFTVESARVDSSIFALGYARLPADLSPGTRAAIRLEMTESLFRSLGEQPGKQAFKGETFVVVSQQSASPLRVVGRIVEHRDIIVRMMASGPEQELSEQIGREFTGSLSLR